MPISPTQIRMGMRNLTWDTILQKQWILPPPATVHGHWLLSQRWGLGKITRRGSTPRLLTYTGPRLHCRSWITLLGRGPQTKACTDVPLGTVCPADRYCCMQGTELCETIGFYLYSHPLARPSELRLWFYGDSHQGGAFHVCWDWCFYIL